MTPAKPQTALPPVDFCHQGSISTAAQGLDQRSIHLDLLLGQQCGHVLQLRKRRSSAPLGFRHDTMTCTLARLPGLSDWGLVTLLSRSSNQTLSLLAGPRLEEDKTLRENLAGENAPENQW